MLAANTTVLAVVGPDAASPLTDVRTANVRVLRTEADLGPLERAQWAWSEAQRTKTPYLVHDADPLARVGDAWARRFDGRGGVGELEVAVTETLARWRGRSLDLPDYYLVVDPEGFDPTRRHWFFGVLASAAANRVVAVRPGVAVIDHLGELRPGRWWPELDQLLTGLDRVVPDQAGKWPPIPDQGEAAI